MKSDVIYTFRSDESEPPPESIIPSTRRGTRNRQKINSFLSSFDFCYSPQQKTVADKEGTFACVFYFPLHLLRLLEHDTFSLFPEII